MNADTKQYKKNPDGLLQQWTQVLVLYVKVWAIPAVVISVLVGAYAVFHANTWEVAQAIMVRNEAIGTEDGIGQFSRADQMKTVEDTILEVVYSRDVLGQTLKAVGPGPKYSGNPKLWPTARDVEDFRNAIGLTAPAGAEFGTTEILYLTVKSKISERGIELTNAMFNQLEIQLRKIRNAKAQSVVAELVRASELARENLETSTAKLAAIETNVGADLSELRMMNHVGGNESTLQRTIIAIQNELRNAKIILQENETLITLLESAESDTERLLATPNRLLESQPSLRALKNGLIAAQLKTAEMQGRMLDTHPQVEAALEAERTTRKSLRREVKTAILGLKNDVVHEKNRIGILEAQREEDIARLQKLAEMRATYENLVKETEHRSELLQKADEQLAQVRANQESTLAIDLIEPIGTPDPGARPIGPSRSMILLGGMFGGLFVGLGLLLMVVPVGMLRSPSQEAPTLTATDPVYEGETKDYEDSGDSLGDEAIIETRLAEVAQLAKARPPRGLHP